MKIITPLFTASNFNTDIWNEMDRVFTDFNSFPKAYNDNFIQDYVMASDMIEAEDHLLVSIDLPGMKKEDIKIELLEKTLTISGERKRELSGKNANQAGRFFGSFKRSFALPTVVEAHKIEAHYQDGVLQIYLPKTPAVQPKKIEVSSGKASFFDKLLNVAAPPEK